MQNRQGRRFNETSDLVQFGRGEHGKIPLQRSGGPHLLEIGLRHQGAQDQLVVVGGSIAFAKLLNGRLFGRGGQHLFGAGAGHDSVQYVRLNRRYRLTVVAGGIFDDFVGNDGISFSRDDIQHRLGPDQLAERSSHPRVAQFPPYHRNFPQHLLESIRHVVLRELGSPAPPGGRGGGGVGRVFFLGGWREARRVFPPPRERGRGGGGRFFAG